MTTCAAWLATTGGTWDLSPGNPQALTSHKSDCTGSALISSLIFSSIYLVVRLAKWSFRCTSHLYILGSSPGNCMWDEICPSQSDAEFFSFFFWVLQFSSLCKFKAYQLAADHYRYRFRTSEKKPDEDFVQWGNRTCRYLNRWMAVAEATGNAEMILEQFMIARLLDAVSPELRAWLKEQKPKTSKELEQLANLHVQSRKGPLGEGKYASFGKGRGFSSQKQPHSKIEVSPQGPKEREGL